MGDVTEAALRWDTIRTNKTLDKDTLMKTYASLAKSYDQVRTNMEQDSLAICPPFGSNFLYFHSVLG